MSRLNASAYEFVPGKGFIAPQRVPVPPAAPLERPEQTEAPRPPPTISLNIGGPKPSPSQTPVSTPQANTPTPKPNVTTASVKVGVSKSDPLTASAPLSKAYTTEKAKTTTTAIVQEVLAVADQAVVQDLYGDGMSCAHIVSSS
jgi:peptide chain release factor subunit 3